MKTGQIEILAESVKVLNRCNAALPFHIHEFHKVSFSLILTFMVSKPIGN